MKLSDSLMNNLLYDSDICQFNTDGKVSNSMVALNFMLLLFMCRFSNLAEGNLSDASHPWPSLPSDDALYPCHGTAVTCKIFTSV